MTEMDAATKRPGRMPRQGGCRMGLSLRWRILLALLPLVLILLVLGGAGAALLYRLGGRIDAILRENYRSVLYMERLNEALERIDSSFQFALAGKEDAQDQFKKHWVDFEKNLDEESKNITVDGERELVEELTQLKDDYLRQG